MEQQGASLDKLPLHHKGELLAGLTQSAQPTGRSEQAAQYLDKMLTVLVDTQYEAMATQWKSDPRVPRRPTSRARTATTPDASRIAWRPSSNEPAYERPVNWTLLETREPWTRPDCHLSRESLGPFPCISFRCLALLTIEALAGVFQVCLAALVTCSCRRQIPPVGFPIAMRDTLLR